jgi:PHB/PHA accumulation regulator DNA-binding domain
MGYHGQSWASKGLPGHYLGWTTNYAFRPKSYRDVTGSTVSFLSFLHFHDLFLRRFGVFSQADRSGAPEPFWIAASLCHDGGMSHAEPYPGRHIVKHYRLARRCDTSTLAYVDVARLRALIRTGEEVVVLDAKSGEDITAIFLRIAR